MTIAQNATIVKPTSLFSPEWLEQHLHDPAVRIIGVLRDEKEKIDLNIQIPGADVFYWKDLLWHQTNREFVDPEDLSGRLGTLGIVDTTQVVLYGDPVQFGFYARWVFRYLGHDHVGVLDGGLPAWHKERRPVGNVTPRFHAATTFHQQARNKTIRIQRDELLSRLHDAQLNILDVRSPEEFAGNRVSPPESPDVGAERGGHIPGAVHLHFTDLLNSAGRFHEPQELRQRVLGRLQLDPAAETVVYCRLSHRATLVFYVLTELLGFSHVRVYDGSWTEWGSMVGAPVVKAPAEAIAA